MIPRLVEPDTADNLHRLFLESHWTDTLPIVLPTEERVTEMLKRTSRKPDEVVGKMSASSAMGMSLHEAWEYTVEKVAVNAVMAGAKPEYFPVILAIASTGKTSLVSSTSSFATMVVVNGPVRSEIGMNSGLGALSPLNQANAAIGRAWTLLSVNLGNGGVPGETYLGSQGNSLNYNNVCFAENEEKSPWEPLHVQKGFKPEESAVSIFYGWGYVPHFGLQEKHLRSYYIAKLVARFVPTALHGGLTLLLDPLVAKDFKERERFDTKEKLSQWLYENTLVPAGEYWDQVIVDTFIKPQATKGVEPYASWLKLPEDAMVPIWVGPDKIDIVVVGAGLNAFCMAGNFGYMGSASIDEWR